MFEAAGAAEAVFFFGGRGEITKEMIYSEFEAVLDGVVGLQDFAGSKQYAAFVALSERLEIQGITLFTIGFDQNGAVDRSWNIPLRHLVDTAGYGPDLGNGPIKLACRSQCSVSWHQTELWDPSMSPGTNTFTHIRQAVERNNLNLSKVEESNMGAAPQSPFAGGVPSWAQYAQPQVPQSPPTQPQPQPTQPVIPELTSSMPDARAQLLKQQEAEQRDRAAQIIKDLRLRISTMENSAQTAVAKLKLEYGKKVNLLNGEIAHMRDQVESLHSQNMSLREQNEAQTQQLNELRKSSEEQLAQVLETSRSASDAVIAQYEKMIEQKVQEASAKLKEDIELRNKELMHRHEVNKKLREEVTGLRKEKIRLMASGSDKFLEKLEDLGVNFIAFHPGAGHISIPLAQMGHYMANPTAFAADRCLVSEEHYSEWLAHYEKPVCNARLNKDETCGCSVSRVDVPSQYVKGESDRCTKHSYKPGMGEVVSFKNKA